MITSINKSNTSAVSALAENQLEVIKSFFFTHSYDDAVTMMHKMMRAAFSRQNKLTKRDIVDIIFLKESLEEVIRAANVLCKECRLKSLQPFFQRWPVKEWLATLNELFHASLHDGFFMTAPKHDDIYYYCRGLHKLVGVCNKIQDTKA